ncbi:MAG: methyltransferase family protein [Candidatus Thorarchaeota archaeon]
MDKFREKLPKYTRWRAAALGVSILISWTIAFILILFVDSVPRLYPTMSILVQIEPILPIIAVLISELIAFRLVWSVWFNRDKYLAKFGELAYQKAIPRGLFGISLVFAICLHIYVPIHMLPPGMPANPLTTTLSSSALSFLGVPIEIDLAIRVFGAVAFLMIGGLTARSAVLTFGIDYMALVYLYYPEESEIQQHEIYSVLRHPAYFGVLSIAAGGLLLGLSVYSLVLFVMFFFGLLAHIRLVEEKELIVRFGESFIDYQKKVPALRIRLRDLRAFFRFLARRGHEQSDNNGQN